MTQRVSWTVSCGKVGVSIMCKNEDYGDERRVEFDDLYERDGYLGWRGVNISSPRTVNRDQFTGYCRVDAGVYRVMPVHLHADRAAGRNAIGDDGRN